MEKLGNTYEWRFYGQSQDPTALDNGAKGLAFPSSEDLNMSYLEKHHTSDKSKYTKAHDIASVSMFCFL